MDINKIENISLEEARAIADEEILIKEHTCIFTDFKDNTFGYSVLVFKNGRHIYFANDYALHHRKLFKEQGKKGLRNFYIREMNSKLFTDEELLSGASSYEDYKKKNYFLRNLWIMQFDYVSAVRIKDKCKTLSEYTAFDPLSMCYLKDTSILDKQRTLHSSLHRSLVYQKNNPEMFRQMIRHELYNHEACITCSADEALESLNMTADTLEPWQNMIVKEELLKQVNPYAYSA